MKEQTIKILTGRINNLEPEIQELRPRKRELSEVKIIDVDYSELERRIMEWISYEPGTNTKEYYRTFNY